ncbi:MAG: hypothetical protein Q7R35_08820 [Elusimicrobiota bacterium]|nr:hypothetical protein [Elusimicrobiota bacterium]
MKKNIFSVLSVLFLSAVSCQAYPINIPSSILKTHTEPFISHRGDGPFDTALALNVTCEPVRRARIQITNALNMYLDYFKGWNPQGEAHVTVITPVEYWQALRRYISIDEIEAIALRNNVQGSDFKVLGVGSGKAVVDGRTEETFFFVAESSNLRRIRQQIYSKFLENGGRPGAFSPGDFYPHITIGYTKRDLHIQDGVIKDMPHSEDKRFEVSMF